MRQWLQYAPGTDWGSDRGQFVGESVKRSSASGIVICRCCARWLQVGTAATGLNAALLAAPAVANADDGTSPPGLSDSFEVTVTDGYGGSTAVVLDVPVTPSSTAAGPGV